MLIFFNTFFFVCQSQMKEKLGKGTVSLEKIIFHSRGLTTYLPKTDFMIDSDRNIKEAREFYLKGARTGKHYFGSFTGRLKKNEYTISAPPYTSPTGSKFYTLFVSKSIGYNSKIEPT